MLDYIPQFFTKKGIRFYIITLFVIGVLFFSYSLSILWIAFGLFEVITFFYFSNLLTKRWKNIKTRTFKKKLFYNSLVIRIVWVIFSSIFYYYMTGTSFEFDAADSLVYHRIAMDLATRGYKHIESVFWGLQVNDMGYGMYLGTVYMLTGKSIFLSKIIKTIWSAWTVLLIYKTASRSFGESTGRIAGIIAMLFPNLILYCGLSLKEVEMLFLTILFIERADYLLRSREFNFFNIVVVLISALLLFTFRTVLGVTALFALFSAIIFSSNRVLKVGKRFVIGIWLIVTVGYLAVGSIANEVEQYWAQRNSNQKSSMQSRSMETQGNKFAKYGSTAIFAPVIFIIPVTTMVDVGGQENQMLINGGNYIKNILAFFVFFILFWIIKNKKWRDFVLIEVFFLAYLAIIAMSSFAHSERFHQPALPFYIIFVSYGIANSTNKTKKYFNYYTIFIFMVFLAWNFIKLKGRGLV